MPNFGEHSAAETPKVTDVPKKPATFQEDLDEAQQTLGQSLTGGMDANDVAMKKQWADMDAHYGVSPAASVSENSKNPVESGATAEPASLEVLYAVSKFEAINLSKEEGMAIGKLIQEQLNGHDSDASYGNGTGPGHQIQILGVRKEGDSDHAITVMVNSGTNDFPDQYACDVMMSKYHKGGRGCAIVSAPTGR